MRNLGGGTSVSGIVINLRIRMAGCTNSNRETPLPWMVSVFVLRRSFCFDSLPNGAFSTVFRQSFALFPARSLLLGGVRGLAPAGGFARGLRAPAARTGHEETSRIWLGCDSGNTPRISAFALRLLSRPHRKRVAEVFDFHKDGGAGGGDQPPDCGDTLLIRRGGAMRRALGACFAFPVLEPSFSRV